MKNKPEIKTIVITTTLLITFLLAIAILTGGCTEEFDSENYDTSSIEVTLSCKKESETHAGYNPALKIPTSYTEDIVILYDKESDLEIKTDNDQVVKKVGKKKKIKAKKYTVTEKSTGKVVSTYYKIPGIYKKLY